jgi:hypothetical protein
LAGHALSGANVWNNQLSDDDSTLGIAVNHKGLMAGKLELIGDLSYSLGTTAYSTQIPYVLVPNATYAPTCTSTGALLCGSTPDIKNETITFKLTGIYQVDNASKVAVGFVHQKLSSNDYYYNFYQTGYTGTGFLPTNEQAPSYSVNAISVSYIYNF